MGEFFSPDTLAKGQAFAEMGKVTQLLFSEGAYQFVVASGGQKKEEFFPFLHLSEEGAILDHFCSCSQAEEKGQCPHLAAGYIQAMKGGVPLHVRFRESLWNQMGQICAERQGYSPNSLQQVPLGFEFFSPTGKCLFFLYPKKEKQKKLLKKLLFERSIENEESSLLFLTLSEEEKGLWKEGRPSKYVRYELSFWADLAKLWMTMEQEEGVKIAFSSEHPPHFLTASFSQMELGFYIDFAHWSKLILPLSTMNTSLKVYPHPLGELKNIIFDDKRGEFFLSFQEEKHPLEFPQSKEHAIEVGQWLYFPELGFYPQEIDPLLQKKRIEKASVGLFLERHERLLQGKLDQKQGIIHPHSISLQYELYIDAHYHLHLKGYVFHPGDLEEEGAHYFGRWVYLPCKGFFPIEEQMFDQVHVDIAKPFVSDFVNRHRVWLHQFEGFQTHVSVVESRLKFKLNSKGNLVFFTRLEMGAEVEELIDFGQWIYVRGKGFYAKESAKFSLFVKEGIEIEPAKIGTFIQQNREDLEHVPSFFSQNTPLEKTGLEIRFNEKGRIEVEPKFFLKPFYSPTEVYVFGDYTYVAKEGFAPIPLEMRLPQGYHKIKEISLDDEPYFVAYELELLSPHVLTIDPRLKRAEKLELFLEGLDRELDAKSGEWLLTLRYQTELGSIFPQEIWQALHKGDSYLFSAAGLFFLRDKRFEWILGQKKKQWLSRKHQLRLTTLALFRLFAVEDILFSPKPGKKGEESKKLFQDLLHLEPPLTMDLSGLKSELRSYQRTGALWLWFLYSYGLSGLLSDEMGLGKTHQAMALIAAISNDKKSAHRKKFLVVCPTSVIYHWEKLIATYLPMLRFDVFHGIERSLEKLNEAESDILLTSYGIVRAEKKELGAHSFDLVVLDELQIAKNEKSQTHQAIKQIKARMRVGLSGTPIENRLGDLKSLFDLVLPGYLPSSSAFREHFAIPIEKYQDVKRKEALSRLIRPFMLRRKKSEVLIELPEKIEEIIASDLSIEQKALYEKIVKTQTTPILAQLEDSSVSVPLTHIFALFSQLKQVCNHPSLILKDKESYQKHQSGKWDLFVELLNETRDSGQKVVVFSQYLDMLDIMASYLKEQAIGFAQIRGSTHNRKEEVARFAADPSCEVFLGSLQAAGVGIDLVAASVVIHYDRWWNPAKEEQATDRVHRIGQKRGVQVFKLVTKGTIEEHIDQMIERKKELGQTLIAFDREDQVKGFTREELIALLNLTAKVSF